MTALVKTWYGYAGHFRLCLTLITDKTSEKTTELNNMGAKYPKNLVKNVRQCGKYPAYPTWYVPDPNETRYALSEKSSVVFFWSKKWSTFYYVNHRFAGHFPHCLTLVSRFLRIFNPHTSVSVGHFSDIVRGL